MLYALSVLDQAPSAASEVDGVDFPVSPLHRVLVIDADVCVDEALLDQLLGALDEGADASWAAPWLEASGAARGLLVQSMHSFEVLDAISPSPRPLCGKALALGPAALEVFRALPDCVGEDLELGVRLTERQLTLKLAGRARVPGAAAPWRDSLARFTRWMQVLRAHRPTLFPFVPLLFASTPLLLVGALVSHALPVLLAVLVLMTARTWLAARLDDAPRRSAWWWLAGEVLLLAAWLGSFARGRVVLWRGRRLLLGQGGVLIPALRRGA